MLPIKIFIHKGLGHMPKCPSQFKPNPLQPRHEKGTVTFGNYWFMGEVPRIANPTPQDLAPGPIEQSLRNTLNTLKTKFFGQNQ